MPDFLTTKELAELLRIKERKVYDLAASGAVPCSKAMGKLLFPRDAVDAWLAKNSSGFEGQKEVQPRPDVFLGSHDPLLDWALRESHSGIATYFDGSADGLSRFERREGVAAGLHLYDAAADDWNTPIVADRCKAMPVVLIEWAKRQRGLILSPRLKTSVLTIADLKGKRVTPRQGGSGAENLFRHLLAEAGLSLSDLALTLPARTENDAALMVLEDKADATFGLAAIAAQYRLPFMPIIEERFDLLINRRAWFEPPLQRFFSLCHSSKLNTRAKDLEGYDLANFGHVHFNGS
ncbi:MAG: substrate-binding domain-containing protein [Geminicoccaceae bacterium]